MSWDPSEIHTWISEPPQAETKGALWSPARFVDHMRRQSSVETVHALVYDIDAPHPDLETFASRVEAALPGIAWWAHSSFSSVPGALRFRVVFEVSRAMTAKEFRIVWLIGARMLSAAGIEVDRACKDASRAYYVPLMPARGAYAWRMVDGAVLDVDYIAEVAAALAEEAVDEQVHVPSAPNAYARAEAYVAKVPGAISGSGGHAHTFALALRLVRGFELNDADALGILRGWNATCAPPWSENELRHKVASARINGRAERGFMNAKAAR